MAQLPIAIKATAEQERLERQATEDLTAALQKWAAALLRNVNSFNLNTMLDRLNNPRWAGNIAMRDALIAIMQRAAEVGVDAGVEALYSGNATKAQPVIDAGGVDWELVNVDAAEWALNYSHLLMNDISSTTRRAIQREIAYYVENSMTINQLRDRIMSLSTFSETRANRIAVTETTRAYAEGNMRAWSDLDYVERVRWQTANDDLVCPICGPLNQQTVAKGELFAGRYYSPPAHVNCRCGVSPVVTGAEEVGTGAFDDGAGAGAPEPTAGLSALTSIDGNMADYKRQEISRLLQDIDNIHKLPDGAEGIRINAGTSVSSLGEVVLDPKTGRPVAINISSSAPLEAVAHELGHYIDYSGLNISPNIATQTSDMAPYASKFYDAVRETNAYKALEGFYYDGAPLPSGAMPDMNYVSYLMEPHELWARAYSQYVAVESGNEALLAYHAASATAPMPESWSVDDFNIIRQAINEILKIVGVK